MANQIGSFQTSVRKSPLGGAEHGSPDSVALREIPFVSTFDLRVKPGTPAFSAVMELLDLRLPTTVGQTQHRTVGQKGNALCMGPDWWLIFGEIDPIQLLATLRAEHHFSIVDVSAQRTMIEVEGPRARQLLELLWEQDLRESHFNVGSCTQGLMAKAPVVLWHHRQQSYNVFVRSSFAGHLWAALVDAGVEYLNKIPFGEA